MKSPKVRLITTEDGSSSLFHEALNETYHSTKGAYSESMYVFIQNGLAYMKGTPLSVLEVGFGTGLNAFLTLKYAQDEGVKVNYKTLEPYPISKEVYRSLSYKMTEREDKIFKELHTNSWEEEHDDEFFSFTKYRTRLEDFNTDSTFDIIYYDAFAPSKQPDVWDIENLKKCYNLLRTEGILVTYCSQGQFKRNLAEIGFQVEVLPGALGKKEMVRAHKL